MISHTTSRRALFARFRGGPKQLRPPWTGGEDAFLDACTRCGRCIEACPTGLLKTGHAGYPIADFTAAACTFCGACAEPCEAGCFDRSLVPAWALRAAIASSCVELKGVTCRRCAETCDTSAIAFRPRLGGSTPFVDAGRCTGCGDCVAPCPVGAISMSEQSRPGLAT